MPDAFRPWPGPVYVVELEAELAASEESRAAARAGIEELRYERSKWWSKLLDATRVSLLDPDSAEARADVARAMGRLARMGRATAEVACVFQLHAERIEDLEDVGSNFDGAPDLEFRLATEALELEQSGLSYQRVPPGYRFPYGHTHKKQEEVYVVVRGSGRMKLDDEIVELKEWDAVRVPPGTWRGYEAGPEGLEILVIGAPNLGEAPREDVEGQRDWWAD